MLAKLLMSTLLLMACSHVQGYAQSNAVSKTNLLLSNAIMDSHLALTIDKNGKVLDKDLAQFAKKLDGVRVLALGEQTHGAGSVFSLKTDIIKYLHQHHGFDLFILESGMYDVREIYQQAKTGKSIKAIAPGNLFYMYANSEEVTPLFNYINAQTNTGNPLMMVGFDSQHTGGIALANLVNDLTKAQGEIDKVWVKTPKWQALMTQIQQVLDGLKVRLPEAEESLFFNEMGKVANNFKQHDNGFWFRISQGLIAQAKRQWQLGDNRSEEMGENIKWWAQQYPDKKIIVWAHTWHLARKGNNEINAGQVVSDALGDAYYMVHFTAEQGKYLSYIDVKNKKVTEPNANSIENTFTQKIKSPINYVENKDLPLKQSEMEVFVNDYEAVLPAHKWSTYWDGLFIIKQLKPATYQ